MIEIRTSFEIEVKLVGYPLRPTPYLTPYRHPNYFGIWHFSWRTLFLTDCSKTLYGAKTRLLNLFLLCGMPKTYRHISFVFIYRLSFSTPSLIGGNNFWHPYFRGRDAKKVGNVWYNLFSKEFVNRHRFCCLESKTNLLIGPKNKLENI